MINKEKHITRRGYTLCFLSKLQDSLRRRDVYVTGSNRWGDPRARLLQGADWQANRIKVYRSLGHPTDPQEAIKSLGHQLDSRYRQVAARLCENEAVELDVSGPKPRLTISPLASLDEPDSLKRLSKMISDLGTVAKLAMRQPFVLFKGLTFQKTLLTGRISPGDHHNKMLRPRPLRSARITSIPLMVA